MDCVVSEKSCFWVIHNIMETFLFYYFYIDLLEFGMKSHDNRYNFCFCSIWFDSRFSPFESEDKTMKICHSSETMP